MDMTRDLVDRWATFGVTPDVRRLALNMDQVEEFDPPPNPTKMSDSRAPSYVDQYGYDSWELDALTPSVLHGLVRDAVEPLIDTDAWEETDEYDASERETLQLVQDNYVEVADFVRAL